MSARTTTTTKTTKAYKRKKKNTQRFDRRSMRNEFAVQDPKTQDWLTDTISERTYAH